MIIEMARVRIAGPRDQRDPTLRLLQDVGDLQVIAPSAPEAAAVPHLVRQLRRMLDDVDAVLAALHARAEHAHCRRRCLLRLCRRRRAECTGCAGSSPRWVASVRR